MNDNLIRNPYAFVLAALTAGVLLLIAELTVSSQLRTQELAELPATSFLATELDDHGSLMGSMLSEDGRVTTAGQLDQPAIFLIGGSTLREGLLPDAVIEDRLPDQFDSSPSVVTLYSFDQSIAESIRIALNLPLDPGDVVAIEVNPRRLGLPRETVTAEWADSRLSLLELDPLAELADETFDASDRTGDGQPAASIAMIGESRVFSPWKSMSVFENRLFLRSWLEGRLPGDTTRSWSALSSGQLSDVSWGALSDFSVRDLRRPLRYAYGSEPLSMEQKLDIAWTVETQRVQAYFENSDFQVELLRSLIEELQARNVDVVLLELPRSPLSADAYAPVWDDYDQNLADLDAVPGATRLDLRAAGFDDDDYYDLEHLLAPSRESLTDLVFRGILGDD